MKLAKISFGAVLGLTLLSSMAQAQVVDNSSATASMNVQAALSLALVSSPDWGRVTRPPTGSARYTLSYATGATTLTSGDGYAFNDGGAGEFTLSGAPDAPVTFAVAIGAFSGAVPVTVFAAHINGTSNSGTDSLDNTGSLTLKLGGIIDVPAAATIETQTATVTVTVDYQ